MAMMNAAAVSVIPNQIIANGIQAIGGIGRSNLATPSCEASTSGQSAAATPTAMPSRLPMTMPKE
jgi:hypothetical protein